MLPNGRGQKHLVSNKEAQWRSKEDTHRTESEKESCLK